MGNTASSCPTEVNVEILTSQMGKPRNYQKYVIGAQINYVSKSIENEENPIQTVNIIYKEILPKEVENERLKLRRQPFYDLFYPLVQKDNYSAPNAIATFSILTF